MSGEFYKSIKTLDVFELLQKMQDNIIFINDLKKFDLSAPLCIMNEQAILNFYLTEKWLYDFPKQSLILKLIDEEKKLFYLPESSYFYYLYYHLLRAFGNYLETGKKIYDEDTALNYDRLNDEIVEKEMDATKFFLIYLQKGSNFTEEDFFFAKKDKINETISELSEFSLKEKNESVQEAVSEPELVGEPEPEIKQEDNSQFEIELDEVNLGEEVKF